MKINNTFTQVLVSPRLRILRHLILALLTFSVSLSFVWGMGNPSELTIVEWSKWVVFFLIIFWGGGSLNIYILTPLFFLKGKNWQFFTSLTILVLLTLGAITLRQILIIEQIDTPLPFNTRNVVIFDYFRLVINISSAFLAIFLLFIGTSTFILFKKWILDMKESEELETATLQLELKLLENQINPHFLFNMLNSANIMVKKDPDTAIHIIGKLEEMLRYLMSNNVHEKVLLNDEIIFLNDFLELEKTRRDYFTYTINKEGDIENVRTAPLLFITFVENAVKHNQDSKAASYVHILFKEEKEKLIFICENSVPKTTSANKVGGIGLANINRRLNLLYKENYSLEHSKTDTSYTVKLELKL